MNKTKKKRRTNSQRSRAPSPRKAELKKMMTMRKKNPKRARKLMKKGLRRRNKANKRLKTKSKATKWKESTLMTYLVLATLSQRLSPRTLVILWAGLILEWATSQMTSQATCSGGLSRTKTKMRAQGGPAWICLEVAQPNNIPLTLLVLLWVKCIQYRSQGKKERKVFKWGQRSEETRARRLS